jgi:hypothetical protein
MINGRRALGPGREGGPGLTSAGVRYAGRLWGRASLECRRSLSIITRASGRLSNHAIVNHPSRNFPMKLLMAPCCQGFPGSIDTVLIPRVESHAWLALAMHSGP